MASPLRIPNRAGFRQQAPRVLAVDCPIRGWNARDSLDDMDPTDAVVLDNWVPGFTDVYLRRGYTSFATGVGSGDVESLMVYDHTTNNHMLAVASGGIYRVDGGGAIGAPLASGFGSNRWQSDMFIGKLVMVNGTDTPQSYDGTTVAAEVLTGTGLTPTDLVGCLTHNSRMYFWENAASHFWYTATLALGAVTKFELAGVASGGGNIINMVSWTRETTGQLRNYLAIMMSSGRTLIYIGSDPGDATNFSLVGVFEIGLPVGPRCAFQVGSDAVVITSDGYQSLAEALQGGRSSTRYDLSDRIQQAALEAIFASSGNFGWQMVFYPLRNWLIVNYPISATVFGQHVLNLRTGAWCRFTNVNARCWALFQEQVYFGGETGNVFRFDEGVTDNGMNIVADGVGAFNYLGTRANRKMVNGLRLLVSSDGSLPLDVQVLRDMGLDVAPGVPINFIPSELGTAEWDKADWDVDSWAGEQVAREVWLDRGELGYSFAPRVRYNGQGRDVRWFSYTYVFEYAGPI